MLLAISAAIVRKTIVLSENYILRPLRFARSDVTMHQRAGIISGLQVVLRLGYHLVQERSPYLFPFAWSECPKIDLAEN